MSRMRVLLTIHGDDDDLLRIMSEGLVATNQEFLAENPDLADYRRVVSTARLKVLPHDPAWQDIESAMREGKVTQRSLAAWDAAQRRLNGNPAVGLIQRQGCVWVSDGSEKGAKAWCSGRSLGLSGTGRGIQNRNGRITEYLVVGVGAGGASIRNMGDAITEHNVRQMQRDPTIPYPLYGSGIRYEQEGSPEKWWDAKEISLRGFDDCEGLASYRAADLRMAGVQAGVWSREIPRPGGNGRLFHALVKVEKPDGSVAYDDPSARLGMPVPSWYTQHMQERRNRGLEV